jgi:hypothetical protein
MAIIDQYTKSNFSLDGVRGLTDRKFGFSPAPTPVEPGTTNSGYPNSPLHRDYSAFENPKEVQALNFNGDSVLKTAKISSLDETDPNAPKNLKASIAGFQTYKSTVNQTYTDKGPSGGHY